MIQKTKKPTIEFRCGFIDIYELFFGNVFNFLRICCCFFGLLFFVKMLFFFRAVPNKYFRDFFEVCIRMCFDIFAELFRDDFLIDRSPEFSFYCAGCPTNACVMR